MPAEAISLQSVSKRYRLRPRSIRDAVPNPLDWLLRRASRRLSNDQLWALKDVGFSLRCGEALGIIGANGAGKSTLLKLLAGVTYPTEGQVSVFGSLCPLIEVGAGFHPDLTGRENIFLNGAILGMPRREIAAKYDDIVAFSGLDGFMEVPVKRYSSGMFMRLAFSVCAQMQPDILLVDEVLAVGDYAFQHRCLDWMAHYRRQGTVVFVSHNLEAVRRLCDRVILLDRGKMVVDGSAQEAVGAYHALLSRRQLQAEEIDRGDNMEQRAATGEAKITKLELRDARGEGIFSVASGAEASIHCEVEFLQSVEEPVFGFFISGAGGVVVYDMNTRQQQLETGCYAAGETATLEWRLKLPLAEGSYEVSVGVTRADLKAYCCWQQGALRFFVHDDTRCEGIAALDAKLYINERPVNERS